MNNIDKWFAKQLEAEKKLRKKLKSFKKAYEDIEETPADKRNCPQTYSEIRGK